MAISHTPAKPKATQTPITRQAINQLAHQSTPAQRAANVAAHQSTPAQRAANVAAHQPTPVKPALTPAQQKNVTAHQSTAAQRALNVQAHQPGYHAVTIPNPAADPDYMIQHAGLVHQQALHNTATANDLAQYDLNTNHQLGALGYNTATHGWNFGNMTPGTIGAAERDTDNDYTTRGMGYSTPYAQASSNLLSDYNQRQGNLVTSQNQYHQTANDNSLQYAAQNDLSDQTALRGAVNRIASKYGVQANQVVPGRTNNAAVMNS